mmetsp:Transcript_89159/g.276020  ORF Transcript_89159/g.276020 Transcript_89159/m.276020 type:complete len:335 (-) Transcript_89159:176-1180(-)
MCAAPRCSLLPSPEVLQGLGLRQTGEGVPVPVAGTPPGTCAAAGASEVLRLHAGGEPVVGIASLRNNVLPRRRAGRLQGLLGHYPEKSPDLSRALEAMPGAGIPCANLDCPSALRGLCEHGLVRLVVANAQHLGERRADPLALEADAVDDGALLEAQAADLYNLRPLADHAGEVPKGQRELVHQFLGFELAVLVVAVLVVPEDAGVRDVDSRSRGAPSEEVHDRFHLADPLSARVRVEEPPLMVGARPAHVVTLLCDEGEGEATSKVLLQELLAASTHDEDPEVLPVCKGPEELPGILRGYGVLGIGLELAKRAVVVEEKGLYARVGLEEEARY